MSVNAPTLTNYLRERRLEVEAALERALPSPPDCPAVLADAMRYSLMAGGKRLRPILCLAAAEGVTGAGEDKAVARSLRDAEPVLIWPAAVPTAMSAIVKSSVSPDRCETTFA